MISLSNLKAVSESEQSQRDILMCEEPGRIPENTAKETMSSHAISDRLIEIRLNSTSFCKLMKPPAQHLRDTRVEHVQRMDVLFGKH